VSLETSSNVSVINFDVFSGSEKRGRRRQYEEPDDVTKIKKHAYERTSGRLENRSVIRTSNSSEVSDSCSVDVNDISECETVPESNDSLNCILYEDIIVVSDDSDEEFPSSQMLMIRSFLQSY